MATIKKAKAKNLSAGPSKKTPIAPKVDPKGQYTKVQERTLGSMKKGGSMKKAQLGDILKTVSPVISGVAGLFGKKKQQSMQLPMGAMGAAGAMANSSVMKKGGKVTKDKKWIQKAVNPKHKGYCTPMTKATCTPKRKALAMTFKKMAKKK
jgi:hypothetical protein